MLFNSIEFAVFLPIVFTIYWCIFKNSLKKQNLLLLVSSYYFYGCWDIRFLFLLIFSTLLDYFTGIKIAEAQSNLWKKVWLWISISVNLGFLGIFKYYNFFVSTMADFLLNLGFQANFATISFILPVGISFYTFHGLSYVLDIYNDKIKPEKSFIEYSVFVSFFPLLVAGPIERANHLLPQIQRPREFVYSKAVDGLRQILWGLFKKIVIADNCAEFANLIFSSDVGYSGSTHVLGAVFFAFQIYCDFSGYSDIALGTARLFGIELLRNFAYPYFSRDIAEFWRRWHISLSSWFKDYVYVPLGGSRGGTLLSVRNTFIIFLLSGFWHGANWTFVVWGALNAMYFLPLLLLKINRRNLEPVAPGQIFPSIREFTAIGFTFCLTVFAWIFFRADNLDHAMKYLGEIFSASIFTYPVLPNKFILVITTFFFVLEWIGREDNYAIQRLGINWPRPLRWCAYFLLIMIISAFAGKQQEFIYFQF